MPWKREPVSSFVAHNTPHPVLRLGSARWIALARLLWLALAVLIMATYVVAVPRDWQQMNTPCSSPCARPRLKLDEIRALAPHGITLPIYASGIFSLRLITAVTYLLVAGVLFWRRAGDAFALFGAYMLLTWGVIDTRFVLVANIETTWWPVWLYLLGAIAETILIFFFALFPTGTFVPLSMRWLAPAFAAFNGGLYVYALLGGAWLAPGTYNLMVTSFNVLWLGSLGVAQTYRYRYVLTATERRQTRWVVLGVVLGIGLNAFVMASGVIATTVYQGVLPPAMIVLRSLYYPLSLLVPLAFGVAILRDGLYGLEVWVRRAVVYILLTGCVVTLYVMAVGATSALLRTTDNLLVSLLVTGLIGVVFQPLRQQLQRGVNRFLYGERDDPYMVLARLSRRLADTVAADAVFPAVVGTIREALQLPYAAIAVREQDELVMVTEVGVPQPELLRLPLVYQHAPVGELVLGLRPSEPGLTEADRRLLTDLSQQVSIAVHAARLTRDLQVSRERLVTAREEERRRLRRDLHDGLGPSLASLSMQLDTARALMPDNPLAGMELLGETHVQLKEAIGNVRRLVYALRPPALDQFGLISALRVHAAREAQQYGFAFELRAPDVLPPLPAAVEVAAYFIVVEAITNVVRHARASACTVHITLDTALELVVTDNGVGLPSAYSGGVGLHSMQERAAELGGTCVIAPAPGGGTIVTVMLPLGR